MKALRMHVCVLICVVGAGAAVAGGPPPIPFGEMRWRSIGPFRGGWSTCVEGVPDAPNVFYFGAAGGGLWRSDDAGGTWEPLFQNEAASSVGALAIAPSMPSVIYVGTGQADARYDVESGAGVFRSDDAGKTWKSVGLASSGAIGRIWIDSRNPDVVLVAAMGHLYGPNEERGIFRSENGGKSWTRTLFVDPDTGAIDLVADPADASVMYAATWQARNYPWLSYFQTEKGPGSGIYRSKDGGRTWSRLQGNGWPTIALGRIGLAAAKGGRIYALVDGLAEGKPSQGGLFRSDDGGVHWARVAQADWLQSGYFGRLTVDPANPDRVYVTGQSVRRSDDGGKTFEVVKGAPGGDDYHFLWINPKHPSHLAVASDQGTAVSVNGGKTWSSWYNQPTGQFYRLAVDDGFPYRIFSGQQDSGTVAIRSRGDIGGVSWRDWFPVGGDERDQDIPDPADPNLVYAAGLGGALTRFDARTGQAAPIAPQLESTYGQRPAPGKFRFTWLTPLAISPRPPHALFLGAQLLFRSPDRGVTWKAISPDVSRAVDGTTGCDGDLTRELAAACGYGVIHAIALSASNESEIWLGTDDGRIQTTRDAGKTWRDVTPPGLPLWTKISTLDLSPIEPGTVYAALDAHRLDDFGPHLWVTRDSGQTWKDISSGLPDRGFVLAARADPVAPRLVYAATETGVFVSLDGGEHWQSLSLNLPTVTVTDLLVHGVDLIAATQGRGLWILDDVGPLRQPSLGSATPRLLKPSDAYRIRVNENRDTPPPPEVPAGKNPPGGAVIDYVLPTDSPTAVQLEIVDSKGTVIRRFSSDDRSPPLEVDRYFSQAWLKEAPPLAKTAGHHRFVWDLRLPRPPAAKYEYSISAAWGEDAPAQPVGALALPGSYAVRLTTGGKTLTQPLTLRMDPRVHAPPGALAQQLEVAERAEAGMRRSLAALEEVKAIRKGIKRAVAPADLELDRKAAAFEEGKESFARLNERMSAVFRAVEVADVAPTKVELDELARTNADLDRTLARWAELIRGTK